MIIRSLYLAALFATALANTEEGAHKAHKKILESASDCTRTYKVIEGDTCDKISALKGVSTHQLANANKKINSGCTNLVIGDTLCLGLKGQDCTKVHIVKETDICFSIAKLAGIPLDILYKNNPNINMGCTNIYPGEASYFSCYSSTFPPLSLTTQYDLLSGSLHCWNGELNRA
uniref:LysM domain-containing protein n=1 Tax=Psilocybe cubensis TaxID=181762 RepID=A0A8H7XMX5_PSICU